MESNKSILKTIYKHLYYDKGFDVVKLVIYETNHRYSENGFHYIINFEKFPID